MTEKVLKANMTNYQTLFDVYLFYAFLLVS